MTVAAVQEIQEHAGLVWRCLDGGEMGLCWEHLDVEPDRLVTLAVFYDDGWTWTGIVRTGDRTVASRGDGEGRPHAFAAAAGWLLMIDHTGLAPACGGLCPS